MKYWMWHFLIACAISAAAFAADWHGLVIWPLFGAVFYAGREIRDREKLGHWDWHGLLAAAVPLVLLSVILS